MAVVSLATQESLGREVALKVLAPTQDPATGERFFREARIASSLHHHNRSSTASCMPKAAAAARMRKSRRGRHSGAVSLKAPLVPSQRIFTLAAARASSRTATASLCRSRLGMREGVACRRSFLRAVKGQPWH